MIPIVTNNKTKWLKSTESEIENEHIFEIWKLNICVLLIVRLIIILYVALVMFLQEYKIEV